jgi:hypothetical protein
VATVHIWCDPACPWTFLTSRWLLEVEKVREVTAQFHVMSLSVLNEHRQDLSESDRQSLTEGWGPVRVAICTELSYGPDGLRALYLSLAHGIHIDRWPLGRDLYARALSRAGLPHSLANASGMPYYDPLVRQSHKTAIRPAGDSVGCPILHLPVPAPNGETVAYFGPVVTPTPRGEAAGRLWDGVVLAAGTDGFFELKRGVNRRPAFD